MKPAEIFNKILGEYFGCEKFGLTAYRLEQRQWDLRRWDYEEEGL